MADERWSVARALTHFDQLLDWVITTRNPIFIDGGCWAAVLISVEDWKVIQDKLISHPPTDL